VSVKGRMIGRQPAWLIRREGHVEMTRLRSIPLCSKKPAKNKKSFAAKVHKWQQTGRRGFVLRDATPTPMSLIPIAMLSTVTEGSGGWQRQL
jgi:hypothetical protein